MSHAHTEGETRDWTRITAHHAPPRRGRDESVTVVRTYRDGCTLDEYLGCPDWSTPGRRTAAGKWVAGVDLLLRGFGYDRVSEWSLDGGVSVAEVELVEGIG